MRVVIADAPGARRDALVEEFERHAHEVVLAESSGDALSLATGCEMGVVARRLGADDGLEVCRALRGAPGGDELVLVVIGSEEELEVADAIAAGATDVWTLDPGVRIRLALAEHYARLQAETVRVGGEFALLRQALDLTGTGFVLTDPQLEDHPIVYVNRSFCELTGYEPAEILGRNCRFLQGPATDPDDTDRLRTAIRAERPVTVETINHRKDGSAFVNEVHVAPVRDARGRVVRFVGVQVDVSAYRRQDALYQLEQRARRLAEAAERRSAFLASVSPLLDASLDLRATLEQLSRLTVPHVADVCLVDVLEGGDVRRVASAAADPGVETLLRRLPSRYPVALDERDAVSRVLRTRRAEVLTGEAADLFGGVRGSLGARAPRAAMLVPLVARGRALGVLALASLEREHAFGDDDLALAEDLARRAALAVDNARLFEEQRSVADVLQRSLLPARLPVVEGIELAAALRPASDGLQVGGDFYDAFPVAGGGLALAIGDVTGKGAEAAALTGLTRHTLRTAARYEQAPSRILEALNAALLREREDRGKYCTVALARLDRRDGHVLADIACGGHPLPLVLRANGDVEPAGRPGTVLGYVPDPQLHDEPVHLQPGDALVLYTDGITEARTSTGLLGDERFAALVRGCAGLSPGAIAERLERAAVQSQPAGPRDDIAIAVAGVR